MLRTINLWLRIRARQIWRILQTVGWPLLTVFTLVFAGVVLMLLETMQQLTDWQLALLLALLPLGIHLQRKDQGFLKLLHLRPLLIYLAEYLALVLAIGLLLALFYGKWLIIPLALGLSSLVPLLPTLPPKIRQGTIWQLSWIPPMAFEWRMGWRQQVVPLLILLLGCTGLSYFTVAPVVGFVIIALLAASFYETAESPELVALFWHQPNFIVRKWWANWQVYLVVTSPLSVTFLVLHAQYWHVYLALLVLSAAYFFFLVAYKYAGYWPNRYKVYNQTAVGLFLLGFFSLFFLPVSCYFLWRYYRRATQQLHYYFPK
ncbi:MAG: hypothetical protein AAF798_05890 [Bacteroidota bacterium]